MDTANIFFDSPEYSEWVTESQLRERYDVAFEKSGWYKLKGDDWVLIIERHGRYKVWCWVGIGDPREEFEKVLDLPAFGD